MKLRRALARSYHFLAQHPRDEKPSFEYKLLETRRIRQLLRTDGVDHPVWGVNEKDAARRWATSLGLPQPQLYTEVRAPSDLDFATLPDAVVIKPIRGTASNGVFLIRRDRASGGWTDLKTGDPLSQDGIVARLDSLVAEGTISSRIVAEEVIIDAMTGQAPPIDWKIYSFYGEVLLLVAKRSLPGKDVRLNGWRFLDHKLDDLGKAMGRYNIDPSIAPPRHLKELVAMAQTVSTAVERPFLRVDLYDGEGGAVFGEITPDPGIKGRFRRDVDEMLGRAWEAAEARLQAKLVRSGAINVTAKRMVDA